MVKLALAQYPIAVHMNIEAWKTYVENWVREASQKNSQILVFPEYGSLELCSLFVPALQADLKMQLIELQKYMTLFTDTYANLAKKYQVYILAPSIPFEVSSNRFINRAFFFNPEGLMAYQDKIHTTRFEDEDWFISAGDPELFLFETQFGKIAIAICFDSEFSQQSFELGQKGLELLLVPSCTGTRAGLMRVHVGSRARALEQQMIVGTSSTVGEANWSPVVDLNVGQVGVFGPPDIGFPEDGVMKLGELNQASWVIADVDIAKVYSVRNQGRVFNYKKSTEYHKFNSRFKVTCLKF